MKSVLKSGVVALGSSVCTWSLVIVNKKKKPEDKKNKKMRGMALLRGSTYVNVDNRRILYERTALRLAETKTV